MTSLNGTVTFTQVDHVAMFIGQNLNFNMARLLAIFLDIHFRISEPGLGLGPRGCKGIRQRSLGMDYFHAAAAATGGGLDDHRKSDLLGNLDRLFNRMHTFLGAGQNRNALLDNRLAGADLVAHDPHALGGWPDKGDAALFTHFGKIGILGEKSVSGMNRFGIGQLRSTDDGVDVEIALGAWRRSDTDTFVGHLDMQRIHVRL